jgi:DNA-binding beta-propeller fold protein YncE
MIPFVPRLSPGQEIAGHRIDGIVGEGGMGVVYRATQLALDRPVALKLIAPALAGDPDFRARFKREARVAASIDHPNVIPVYGAGEHEGTLMLAMRFVDGIDLASYAARSGGLPPERAVAIVSQIAAALDAAHAAGLVHRDVKPQNVLLTGRPGEEHAYLTDFGLAKRHTAAEGVTRSGSFIGTAEFASPEQIRGEPTGPASDVYSLGCVLFTIIALRPPFDRDTEVARLFAHLNDPPPRLSDVARVSPALDEVILRAMAKDPRDRYASAGELARAATAALADGDGAASPWAPTPHGDARRRGARALAVALPGTVIAGLLVLVLAIAGVFSPAAPAQPESNAAQVAETPTPTRTPEGPRVADTIDIGAGADGLAVQDGKLLVAQTRPGTVRAFDARSGKPSGGPIDVGRRPDGVAGGRGVLWVAGAGTDQVLRLEQQGDRFVPTARVPVGDSPEGIALGPQVVWVANRLSGTVERIDRATPSVLGAPIGVGRTPTGISVGSEFVWVTNNGDDTVSKIDLANAAVVGDPIPVGKRPRGVIEAFGSVWVANSHDDTVTRLNARTGEPVGEPINVGENPRELAAGLGSVWVTDKDSNAVTRIDGKTGRVDGSAIPVGTRPIGIAVAGKSVYVGNFGDNTVSRIDVP